MGLPVYDFRKDVRNVFTTPRIRSRFMRMDAGAYAQPHSHDLGHEVFIVMEGQAVFEIDGESAELEPGQMCVALADQLHSIQVTGDGPMTMYLSVTPHILPTHTTWHDDGRKLPHSYGQPGSYDQEPNTMPTADLAEEFVDLASVAAAAAQAAAAKQRGLAEAFVRAIEGGDPASARDVRNSMWDALFLLYQMVDQLSAVWNDLAPRADLSQ